MNINAIESYQACYTDRWLLIVVQKEHHQLYQPVSATDRIERYAQLITKFTCSRDQRMDVASLLPLRTFQKIFSA